MNNLEQLLPALLAPALDTLHERLQTAIDQDDLSVGDLLQVAAVRQQLRSLIWQEVARRIPSPWEVIRQLLRVLQRQLRSWTIQFLPLPKQM